MKHSKRKISLTILKAMAKHLQDHRFKAQRAALEAEEPVLALQIYTEHFGEENIKQMRACPKGWLNTISRFYFSVYTEKGDQVRFSEYRKNGSYFEHRKSEHSVYHSDSLRLPEQRNVCYPSPYVEQNNLRITEGSPLLKMYQDYKERLVDAEIEEADYFTQMYSTLSNLGNFHDIYAAWPEVRELLITFEPAQKAVPMLPAVMNVSALNKELGIPSAEIVQ